MSVTLTRRDFIVSSAAAGAGYRFDTTISAGADAR
jgi:hypothetical protein